MNDMLNIAGVNYVFNFNNLDDLLTLENKSPRKTEEVKIKEIYGKDNKLISKEVTTKIFDKPKEIDLTKYEIIKALIEIILTYNDDFDDALGFNRALNSAPLSFKISFNTLIEYGIIKEVD
jgi:hypothetical protein